MTGMGSGTFTFTIVKTKMIKITNKIMIKNNISIGII
jgi:hypothetical protein